MDDITHLIGQIVNKFDYAFFIANGKKPWNRGYNVYKNAQILKAIAQEDFDFNKLPLNYGLRIDERIIEYPWLLYRLPLCEGKLLDAGSTLNFDFILTHKVLESKKIFISTLAPEGNCYWKGCISYIYEDLRETCYKDDFFDWVVSLSTIEHIGLDNTMLYTNDISKTENNHGTYLQAIKEFHRILKPGGVLYITVPFGKKKNHGWFQVFDSKEIDNLIEVFSPKSFIESHFKYEPDGWRVSSRYESKDATCFDIHHQKSYDSDYAAFSRAIVCLEMVK